MAKRGKHGKKHEARGGAIQAPPAAVRKALRKTKNVSKDRPGLAAAVAAGLGSIFVSQRVRRRLEDMLEALLDKVEGALGIGVGERADVGVPVARGGDEPLGAPNGIAEVGPV